MQQPVDTAALEELKNIMGEDFALLIDVFVSDSEQRISGLKKALSEKNALSLRNIAHGFKGSALNLSATQLTELCRQLEAMGRDNLLDEAPATLTRLIEEFDSVKRYFIEQRQ